MVALHKTAMLLTCLAVAGCDIPTPERPGRLSPNAARIVGCYRLPDGTKISVLPNQTKFLKNDVTFSSSILSDKHGDLIFVKRPLSINSALKSFDVHAENRGLGTFIRVELQSFELDLMSDHGENIVASKTACPR